MPASSITAATGSRDEQQGAHGALFVGLLILLAWVPIPIGSNRPWSVSLLEAGALFLVGIWALGLVFRPSAIPGMIPRAVEETRLALIVFSAWLCVPLLQLVPLPLPLAGMMTGDLHDLYGAVPGGGAPDSLPMSLDRGATIAGFLRQCALVSVFFCVLCFVTSRRRIRMILTLIFAVGFAESLYGLLLYVGGGEAGLWSPGHDERSVSGTYVNQNHFAGLLEMAIPAGLGLLLMSHDPGASHRGMRGLIHSISSLLAGSRGLILFGLLLMFAALILSTSRGAVGSLAVAVLFTILLAVFRRGAGARELRIGLITAVLIGFSALWMGAGQLMTKLETSGLSSNRGDLRELSYELVAEAPVLGTGVGTYRWVLPSFKDSRFGSGFYEHAHNDYLEVLGEQGIVGFGLLALALGIVLFKIVKSYRREHDPVINGALFAAIAGCGSLLVHGFVDFNLQIPANAAYFAAMLGIGVVASTMSGDTSS